MKELALKYGCNPNQKPSRIFMEEGELPIEVLNGRYGPYLTFGGKNYRLPKAMHARAADLTLEECVEVIDAAEQKSEQKKK
mgnify:CR=1 FL=1